MSVTQPLKQCDKCGDSGWKKNIAADGKRIWSPLMNDATPCECGALAKRYAQEKALIAKATKEQP